jgi:hypothetical protein
MSYSNTIKDKFVELRASGKSFGKISEELGIVKSTLHRWADEREEDILRLRRLEWEDIEHDVGWRIEDQLAELNSSIDSYERHLRRFGTYHLSLRDTIMVLRESRRERDRLRALLMGTGRSRKSNKTERFTENGTTEHRDTNDLQQSKPKSFHFPFPENPAIETHDSRTADERSNASPLPGGEGQGEGGIAVPAVAPAESNSPQSAPSVVSQASNKTERFQENGTTQPRNTNDLQQPKLESFDFPRPKNPAVEPNNSPSREEPPPVPPLPRGEGGGEGQTGTVRPVESLRSVVHQEPPDESIVIGPDEPASSIAQRCGLTLTLVDDA